MAPPTMASEAISSTADSQEYPRDQTPVKPIVPIHKRTYQACLPCRRRKVRCDLGSVDDPGDPPCQRCRREKKECVFSETRRKRKADDENGFGGLTEEYIQRNKRIGTRAVSEYDDSTNVADGQHPYGAADEVNGYDESLAIDGTRKKGENIAVRNETAATLFGRTITMPSDALHMLVDAASRTETEDRRRKETETNTAAGVRQETAAQPMIDPAIVAMQARSTLDQDPMMAKALNSWASVRFVQAGWFTPQEGIAFVQFFYEHLAPFTPVSPPDFSNPFSHETLLNDEPMLTVTILTIASRYMELKGPGAKARGFWIHDKMWTYLQKMITRMFWGQEQFGGGFCGAGRYRTVEEAESRRRGLRSLGTVESLLLLSDWLPRSMHFPPGDDGGDIIVSGPANVFDSPEAFNPGPKTAVADWTEPAIRSDRMCWSLVGTAYTLAFELGVFDSLIEEGKWTMGRQQKTFYDSERADRIGRLLFVYVSQTCGRLGFPNMMPHQGTEHDFDFLKMDIPPGTYVGPYASVTSADRIQRAWAELTALMRQSNTELFESKTRTNEAIKTGKYMEYLERFIPKLNDWKQRFEQTDVPEKARIMLMMEYEYSRTYINSLSLQAVLDNAIEQADPGDVPVEASNGHTPPAFISSKTVDLKEKNKPYISELIDAARNLLTLAVENLHRVGGLKNAPVRTHFRILSGAMFLLKTFALGDTQSEVLKSLRLLDQTIKTLRESVPDDVHLSLRISELLSSLTAALRTKFVRLRVDPKASKRSGGNTSKTPTSHSTSKDTTNKPSSSGGNRPTHHPRSYSYTALGIQPREVDLNDLNTTIMPPPNFPFYNTPFGDSYALVDSPSTPSAQLASPAGPNAGSAQTPPSMRPRHNSNSAGNPMFSPNAAFSPLSSGSGAQPYDWLTIDINPLLQSMHHNAMGNTQSTPTSQSGQNASAALTSGNAPLASRGASPNISAPSGYDYSNANGTAAWTNGAFGPEISEGLEWLGALGTGTGGFGDWTDGNTYP